MRIRLSFTIRWLGLLLAASAAALRPAGAGLVFQGPIGTSELATNRVVRVWLPPGYTNLTTARFPVLYVQDGQNVFSNAGTNAAHGWGSWNLDLVAEGLIQSNRMSPLILVGIDSTRLRALEYRGPFLRQPVDAPGRAGDAPEFSAYDAYRNFLVRELKPWVDSNWRTSPGPESTGLLGAALGGFVSLCLAFENPEVFGLVGCLSGSFDPGSDAFVERLRGRAVAPAGLRVFLDSGRADAEGGDDRRAVTDAVAEEFRRLGWRDGREFLRMTDYDLLSPRRLAEEGLRRDKWEEAKRSQHNEFYWRRRVWRALGFLYPPPPGR